MSEIATAPLSDDEALALAEVAPEGLSELMAAARAVRDQSWGRRVTYSPKVFLPLTNLCKNYCSYCAFRRSPGQSGAWTMTPSEVREWAERARDAGCAEALFCLGDKPEATFPSYQTQLHAWRFDDTVDYLCASAEVALAHGLLPHTNAGVLSRHDMAKLRAVNVSLGLMLESASERLCEPGMPHHLAPDKRPEVRLRMIDIAGEMSIPFTTGILIGIGETRRERVEALLAIRQLHRRHGHVQEVIVQNFRATPRTLMRAQPDAADADIAHAVAMARLVLDAEVSVQAPPNLNAAGVGMLLAAGVNDLGGISPVSPDYVNPKHPWPHLDRLAEACARDGYSLAPRLAIYDRYLRRDGFLDAGLTDATARVGHRIARVQSPADLALPAAAAESRAP